ncbi:MAG: hypothetical protein LCH98_07605 [Actinobacteria bacterium]|nr:hypothetical protein [Actinomycetota bacterium]
MGGLEGSRRDVASETSSQLEGVRPMESPRIGELGFKERPDYEFRAKYEDEYIEPLSRPAGIEPFDDPRRTVQRINPEFESGPEYQTNCADCSRCFERTWRGSAEEAAGRRPLFVTESGDNYCEGEYQERLEEWAGAPFKPLASPDQLHDRLAGSGHGASAMIVSFGQDRNGSPYAHAYNAVNYRGQVTVVDAQEGIVPGWNSESLHPDLPSGGEHFAMAWDKEGRRIW